MVRAPRGLSWVVDVINNSFVQRVGAVVAAAGLLGLAGGAVGCLGRPSSPAKTLSRHRHVSDRAPSGLLLDVELELIELAAPIPCDPKDPFGPSCPIAPPRGYSLGGLSPGERLVFTGRLLPGTYDAKVVLYGDEWRGNARVVEEEGTIRRVVFKLDTEGTLDVPMRAPTTGAHTRTLRLRFPAIGYDREEDACDVPSGWADMCHHSTPPPGSDLKPRQTTRYACTVSLPGPPPQSFRAEGCDRQSIFISISHQICQATTRGNRDARSGIEMSRIRQLIRCQEIAW